MRIARTMLGVVLVAGAAAAWALTLRPQSLGGPSGYVMVRGVSMNPTYRTGDLVVTRSQGSYGRGDIVAYRVPKGDVGEGIVVIHRIIGGSARDGYLVQGDNNEAPDGWLPKNADVMGKAWFALPRGGLVLAWLHAPVPLASMAAGIVIAMVLVPAGGEERDVPSRGGRRRPAAARPRPSRGSGRAGAPGRPRPVAAPAASRGGGARYHVPAGDRPRARADAFGPGARPAGREVLGARYRAGGGIAERGSRLS